MAQVGGGERIATAKPGDLRVLATAAIRIPLEAVRAEAAKAIGHPLVIEYGSARGNLKDAIMAGTGTDGLDRSKPIAVICRSGNRSELAATMLQARGFEAYNVEGGMEAWAREGLPFQAPDGSPACCPISGPRFPA